MSKNKFSSFIMTANTGHIPFKIRGGIEFISCNNFSCVSLLACLVLGFGLENKFVWMVLFGIVQLPSTSFLMAPPAAGHPAF